MLILLEMIPIYLQNKTKIKHVANKIVKLFKFNTMYVLFPQSLNVRSPHPLP